MGASENDQIFNACNIAKLERAAKTVYPLAVAGLTGWALIWLYRGLKWPSAHGKVKLPTYIRQTYAMSKLFALGTVLATSCIKMDINSVMSQNQNYFLGDTANMNKYIPK